MSICLVHHTNASRGQGLGTGNRNVTGQYSRAGLRSIMRAGNSFSASSGQNISLGVSLSGKRSAGLSCSLRAGKSRDRRACLRLSIS